MLSWDGCAEVAAHWHCSNCLPYLTQGWEGRKVAVGYWHGPPACLGCPLCLRHLQQRGRHLAWLVGRWMGWGDVQGLGYKEWPHYV
eukprot:1153827-Pelagomonas_calceolata.AAC.6